jgi:hypothetical protein
MNDFLPLLDPLEAEAWLAERGQKIRKNTLSKLRCTGGGPRFVHYGRSVKYRADWLEEWVRERTSVPKRSTSERYAARESNTPPAT